MKSRYLLGAGAALVMALTGAEANAQFAWMGGPYPLTYYIGPEGGWTSLSNQKTTITTAVPFNINQSPSGPFFQPPIGSARYNSGFNVGVRGGVQWGPWRLEEEYSYRHNGLSSFQSFTGPGFFGSSFTGNRNTNSIMTNFIYDFTIGWPITPHIGFGIGAVNTNDSVSPNPTQPLLANQTLTVSGPGGTIGKVGAGTPFTNPVFGGTFLKGNTWQFGYQAIVGIRYDINPLLAFDLDYRYLATTEPT